MVNRKFSAKAIFVHVYVFRPHSICCKFFERGSGAICCDGELSLMMEKKSYFFEVSRLLRALLDFLEKETAPFQKFHKHLMKF